MTEENRARNVYELVSDLFLVEVTGEPLRFSLPGWYHLGLQEACCPDKDCRSKLQSFRLPYKKPYKYWALACLDCKKLFTPKDLLNADRILLKDDSDSGEAAGLDSHDSGAPGGADWEDLRNSSLADEIYAAGREQREYNFDSLEGLVTEGLVTGENLGKLKEFYNRAKTIPLTPKDAFKSKDFKLEKMIGSGATGEVWRGEHRRIHGKKVAIKFLNSSSSITRSDREAGLLATASAKSHYIVKVENNGNWAADKVYIVMEWIDGRSLKQIVDSGDLPSERRTHKWMEQLCSGMIEMANCGIIHRDLKPSNIMILNSNHEVRIIDFGLAKALPSEEPEKTDPGLSAVAPAEGKPPSPSSGYSSPRNKSTEHTHTHPDGLVGTPLYMAPEIWINSQNADVRSDIYSFGITCYQVLTGKTPFTGSTKELEIKHREHAPEEPEPPAESTHIFGRTLRIIMRCLEKSPDDRFQSFSQIRPELHDVFRHRPKIRRRSGEFLPTTDWRLHHKTSPWRHWEIAEREEDNLNAIIRDFTAVLQHTPDSPAILVTLAEAYHERGNLQEAIKHFSRAIAIEEDSHTFCKRGHAYHDNGEASLAISDYREALRINPEHAEAYLSLGISHAEKNEFEDAISNFTEAIRFSADDASAWYNRGLAYSSTGEFEDAIKDFDEAIVLDPDDAEFLSHRAAAFNEIKEYDRALKDLDEASRIDPKLAQAWTSRGYACFMKENYDEAIDSFNKAAGIVAGNAFTWYFLGRAYMEKSDRAQAILAFSRAIKLDPDNSEYLRARGGAYELSGDTGRAEADFSKADKPETIRFVLRRNDLIGRQYSLLMHDQPSEEDKTAMGSEAIAEVVVDREKLIAAIRDGFVVTSNEIRFSIQQNELSIISVAYGAVKKIGYSRTGLKAQVKGDDMAIIVHPDFVLNKLNNLSKFNVRMQFYAI